MMPAVGVIENVSGNKIATPFGPPRPGSTPIRIPSTTPATISMMWFAVRATENPCIK
jgi:hypothetical protein